MARKLLQTNSNIELVDNEDPDFGDDTCEKILMDLSNKFIQYNDTVLHMFRNSGKDYNDYGRYHDCLNIHNFNYFMVLILHRFPIPFTWGLCMPSQCQVEDLMEFRPFLAKAFNAAIPNMFEDVRGFDPKTLIDEADILVVESHVENVKVRQFSTGALMVLIFFLAFAFTVLGATGVLWRR